MKKAIFITLCSFTSLCFSQTTSDIFNGSDYEYTYLGIDYSHAKFVGEFSQIAASGTKGVVAIKDDYFTGWNNVVNNERDKYSLKDALRKDQINYALDDIRQINESTVVEEMEGSIVRFSKDDIQGFINNSNYSVAKGIGIMFFAEYLDKNSVEACFHFVIISMESKEILIHERMTNSPGGFGLRNYWIRPVYLSIEKIRMSLYKRWKKEHAIKK
jgi:hypothetical protein